MLLLLYVLAWGMGYLGRVYDTYDDRDEYVLPYLSLRIPFRSGWQRKIVIFVVLSISCPIFTALLWLFYDADNAFSWEAHFWGVVATEVCGIFAWEILAWMKIAGHEGVNALRESSDAVRAARDQTNSTYSRKVDQAYAEGYHRRTEELRYPVATKLNDKLDEIIFDPVEKVSGAVDRLVGNERKPDLPAEKAADIGRRHADADHFNGLRKGSREFENRKLTGWRKHW